VAGVNEMLYARVSQLIPEAQRIVLDLTDLTHMNSMGLGTVPRLYISPKSAGCDLELINLGEWIYSHRMKMWYGRRSSATGHLSILSVACNSRPEMPGNRMSGN